MARPLSGPLQDRVEARLHADVGADRLPWGTAVHKARFDHLVLLETSPGEGVRVEAVDGADVAGRLAVLLENDLLALRAAWLRSRYRAPAGGRAVLDDLEERQRYLVRRCLAGRTVLSVRHPARGSLTTLVTCVSHHLTAALRAGSWCSSAAFRRWRGTLDNGPPSTELPACAPGRRLPWRVAHWSRRWPC